MCWLVEHKLPPYSQKTFGRSFDKTDPEDWKLKLQLVHDWLWKKCDFVKDTCPFQLSRGQEAQGPGIIKDEVAQALQSIVDELGSKTKYPRML